MNIYVGKMTSEQLLQPRYKVIALWPFCPDGWEVGRIIEGEIVSLLGMGWEMKDYPANLRPMPWHEERAAEDMPEYVRVEEGNFYKIKDWGFPHPPVAPWVFIDTRVHAGYVSGTECAPLYGEILPATLEEYNAFIKGCK